MWATFYNVLCHFKVSRHVRPKFHSYQVSYSDIELHTLLQYQYLNRYTIRYFQLNTYSFNIRFLYIICLLLGGCIGGTWWKCVITIKDPSVSLMVSICLAWIISNLIQAAPYDTKQVPMSRSFIACWKTQSFVELMYIGKPGMASSPDRSPGLVLPVFTAFTTFLSAGRWSPRRFCCLSFIRLQAWTISRAQAEMMHVYCLDFVYKGFYLPTL